MKRLLLLGSVLLLSAHIAFSQSANGDRCEVVSLDVTGKKLDQLGKLEGTPLGTFETVVGEEELTTRIYRLPKTKLFVAASVWYTDESLASEKGADSISLQLTISAKPKRDVSGSLIFSDAEMPLNGFDVARVTTMVKSMRRTFFIVMECRKHVRP